VVAVDLEVVEVEEAEETRRTGMVIFVRRPEAAEVEVEAVS
jgi:hypothetical protein